MYVSLGLGSLPAPSLPPTARSPNARARQRCRRFAHRASTAVPPSLCPTRQYSSAAFALPNAPVRQCRLRFAQRASTAVPPSRGLARSRQSHQAALRLPLPQTRVISRSCPSRTWHAPWRRSHSTASASITPRATPPPPREAESGRRARCTLDVAIVRRRAIRRRRLPWAALRATFGVATRGWSAAFCLERAPCDAGRAARGTYRTGSGIVPAHASLYSTRRRSTIACMVQL